MNFYRDRQIKGFLLFIFLYAVLILGTGLLFCYIQTTAVKSMYLEHDTAVISSLLEQGVSEEAIATAITNTQSSAEGTELLTSLGIGHGTVNELLPFISHFQNNSLIIAVIMSAFLVLLLFVGIVLFLQTRKRLYIQAENVIRKYIDNDYSCHLPQNSEGEIYQLFASVEQLATMLQATGETERKTKEFLKRTISDISHQLKTPLAALTMYQEIIESEPENTETVKEFSAKIGASIKRIEQLIQSMLKITHLDTGNIIFEKRNCLVTEIVAQAVNELTTRAENENKKIQISGNPGQSLICDMEWTSEAIGNIVKNALDHTKPGGTINITWENAPTMLRIIIADNGNGIAPEDIHHIFKRFYRSKHSLDTQGIGLGLSLAKSIIEGQNGLVSVHSVVHEGTVFTLSFLTNS